MFPYANPPNPLGGYVSTFKGPSPIRTTYRTGLWTVVSHLPMLLAGIYTAGGCCRCSHVSRILNHIVSRVVTPMVVHAVQSILLGYSTQLFELV